MTRRRRITTAHRSQPAHPYKICEPRSYRAFCVGERELLSRVYKCTKGFFFFFTSVPISTLFLFSSTPYGVLSVGSDWGGNWPSRHVDKPPFRSITFITKITWQRKPPSPSSSLVSLYCTEYPMRNCKSPGPDQFYFANQFPGAKPCSPPCDAIFDASKVLLDAVENKMCGTWSASASALWGRWAGPRCHCIKVIPKLQSRTPI